jgi:hypothetical protein
LNWQLIKLVVVLTMITCSHQVMAQRYYANRHKGHRIFTWAGVGYSRLDLHLSNVSTLGYAGGSLGVGYGYSFSERWSINAGVEYTQLSSSIKPFDFAMEVEMLDTEEMPFIMRYDFSRYRERQHAHYINVLPLSVEYARGRFYCAVGAKAGLHLSATAVTTASHMETAGRYPQYIGDFTEMPDHYFDQKPNLREENRIRFGLNLMASAEVGMNIRNAPKRDPLRIALFCDYGLSNIQQSSGKALITIYEANPTIVNLNSLAGSTPKRITALLVGLKLTVFFKSPSTKRVYPCFCY